MHKFIMAAVAAVIGFIGMFGFGLSTNLWEDFLGVSKEANDAISFFLGIAMAIFLVWLSLSVEL